MSATTQQQHPGPAPTRTNGQVDRTIKKRRTMKAKQTQTTAAATRAAAPAASSPATRAAAPGAQLPRTAAAAKPLPQPRAAKPGTQSVRQAVRPLTEKFVAYFCESYGITPTEIQLSAMIDPFIAGIERVCRPLSKAV